MLCAQVPEPPVSASRWRFYEDFHWRLHVHHRTRHTAGITVSVVRESNFSDVRIGLRLRILSDDLGKPVRNLMLASKEHFPHERNVTTHLPAGIASKSVKLYPIVVPLARFTVGLSLDIQDSFTEADSQSDRTLPSLRRNEHVSRFPDSYSSERTIRWIEEREPLSHAASLDSGVGTDPCADSYVGAAVPHNLSTLLESCNQGEHGPVQALDATFSDVTLIVGSGPDTRAFNLHRCVLALVSPVFRAMLSSEMIERCTGTIKLPNFTPSAMGIAVRHIYGSPVNVIHHAFELYHFAHQFDISSLCHTARAAILHRMESRNCAHILRFGVSFGDEEVVNVAYRFIVAKFSEIVGDDVAANEMCHIPEEIVLRVFDDDTIKATELEILLFAMRWLSMNKVVATRNVFSRVRWGLISPEILDLTECVRLLAASSERRGIIDKSMNEDEADAGELETRSVRRRWLGKPNATMWVPLVSRPPAVFLPSARSMNTHSKRRVTRRFRTERPSPVQTTFDYGNLRWTLRAKLDACNSSPCCGSRLSASLWLEEGDDGRVWTKDTDEQLPLRALANLMVWNHLGGQLHVVPINVVFRSAGWGNGWCVRDLLSGGKHGLADYGEAVQVAIEMRETVRV